MIPLGSGGSNPLPSVFFSVVRMNYIMEPKIITKEEFSVIGIERRINIDRAQVLELWDDFKKRISDVTHRAQDKSLYSICKYDPNFSIQNLSESTELDLLMGVEVNSLDEIPKDMTSKKIPTQKYAVFRVTDQNKAYEYIYGDWSYNSGYHLEEADDFERYDEQYDPHNPSDREFEIYIPIK